MQRTTRGRTMPIDREPNAAKGNVQICVIGGEEIAAVLGPADVAAAQAAGIVLYTSHFYTCPSAATHRKRG